MYRRVRHPPPPTEDSDIYLRKQIISIKQKTTTPVEHVYRADEQYSPPEEIALAQSHECMGGMRQANARGLKGWELLDVCVPGGASSVSGASVCQRGCVVFSCLGLLAKFLN